MFHLALFENTLDFFVKGGVFMAVLLLCSFVALTVILLRSVALRRRAVIPALIEKEINKIRPGDEPEHLRHLIQDDSSPLSRIVEVAVRPYNATKQETLEVVQSRARQEIVRLESGLFILEIVVGIAPLLGLLGAVTGLVRVFGNIGNGAMSTSDLKGYSRGDRRSVEHDDRRIGDCDRGSGRFQLLFPACRAAGGRDGVAADRSDREDFSRQPRVRRHSHRKEIRLRAQRDEVLR